MAAKIRRAAPLLLVALFSCSGSSGQQTFVETCDRVQMLYQLDNGTHKGTIFRCITARRPELTAGLHEGAIGWHDRGEPWK